VGTVTAPGRGGGALVGTGAGAPDDALVERGGSVRPLPGGVVVTVDCPGPVTGLTGAANLDRVVSAAGTEVNTGAGVAALVTGGVVDAALDVAVVVPVAVGEACAVVEALPVLMGVGDGEGSVVDLEVVDPDGEGVG
jgi:hypothetical protein